MMDTQRYQRQIKAIPFERIWERMDGDPDVPYSKGMVGNCYPTASALRDILKEEISDLPGETRLSYGMYWGDSVERPSLEHHRHAWITWTIYSETLVIDPTKWVFDGVDPYIHIGPVDNECQILGWQEEAAENFFNLEEYCLDVLGLHKGEFESNRVYDEGAVVFKSLFMTREIPEDSQDTVGEFDWTEEIQEHLSDLFQDDREVCRLSLREISFIANLNPDIHKDYAREIYRTLIDQGFSACIPIDFVNMAGVELSHA